MDRTKDADADGTIRELQDRIATLEQAVAARDEFIATVAHELRNPLSPLVFRTRLLLDRLSDPAATVPATSEWTLSQVRRLEQQLHRLLETLDRVLDVSRLSTGRIDLSLEQVDLGAVMREVIASFDAELAVAGCDVRYQDRRRVVGHWDRVRVEQICRNLFSNAIRYGAGRPIDVTVDAVDDAARLDVRDHGIGIERDHQQRIFERFERVDTVKRGGGFGIGLWVVRNICVALGGSVTVDSEIGQGACFRVTLPLRAERARRDEGASSDRQ